MNRENREWFRRNLEELRDRLEADITQIERETAAESAWAEDVQPANVPGDYADMCLDDAAETINVALRGNEEYLLEEVNSALERLDRRVFGCCEGCRRMISSKRLRTVPYARLCRECARAESRVPAF
jgi:RNA polymerase-binding transcription factor DksA